MKKSILIICSALAILILMAFGFVNSNSSKTHKVEESTVDIESKNPVKDKTTKRIFSDFIYDVGPRFSPIKKSDLDKATSITDFLSEDQMQRIVSFKSVEVFVIENDQESDIRELGVSEMLNSFQLQLLRATNYSTNLKIRADYIEKNRETGDLEESYSTPHLTIVPEKQAVYLDQAVYKSGKSGLIEYLKEKSKESRINIEADKLQPAKLFFTVSYQGTIENVRLDRSSNYPTVDKKMIELVKNTSGKWQPAENVSGEKVDQELVVSFGLMGC